MKFAGERGNVGHIGNSDIRLVVRRKEKRLLERTWREWNGGIKMNPEEVGYIDLAWFQLA
jgi:hypothetical protein